MKSLQVGQLHCVLHDVFKGACSSTYFSLGQAICWDMMLRCFKEINLKCFQEVHNNSMQFQSYDKQREFLSNLVYASIVLLSL